ncbi:hypothetical protein HYH02_005523 [Chlamydomonas schloesseri]|uniref:Uncharacterized protein n=1 Tax=Chlamydomonas schloesseri TaxID=2026947 RepID=A0A835WMD6_9CHLO|nr:hypothetical protein HYH02_005523 [Chlamydomonas schloesseri]|eukprot:KAG2449370.1 hypothetical protein HYH02_005523 [Chlamydomonas schloesseri]
MAAGASCECIGAAASGLADDISTALEARSSSAKGSRTNSALAADSLALLGAAVQQQSIGAAGAAAITASLCRHARFQAFAVAGAKTMVRRADLLDADGDSPPGAGPAIAESLKALALARPAVEDGTCDGQVGLGNSRIAGAATLLATRLQAQHANDAKARAQACCTALLNTCAAQGAIDMHGGAAAPCKATVMTAMLAHADFVAAALAAPGAGAHMARALRDACTRRDGTGVAEVILSHEGVMAAVLAAPVAAEELAHAVASLCGSSTGVESLLQQVLAHARVMRAALSDAHGVQQIASALLGAMRTREMRAAEMLLSKPSVLHELLARAPLALANELVEALRVAASQLDAAGVASSAASPHPRIGSACVPQPALLRALLLGDAGALRDELAQERGGGRANVLLTLVDACSNGDAGLVGALLHCEPARSAALDAQASCQPATTLVRAVTGACEARHAAVVQLLLADAGFVEVMLGAGGSNAAERLAKMLEQARERGEEEVAAALLGNIRVAEAMAPHMLPPLPPPPPPQQQQQQQQQQQHGIKQ